MQTEGVCEFSVAGLAARTDNELEMTENGQIRKLWRNFFEGSFQTGADAADDGVYAVYTEYESDENGDYTFVLGRRIPEQAEVRADLTTFKIREGRYAVFTADEGPAAAVVPALWKRIWSMSKEELGGQRAFQTDYEVHGKNNVQILWGFGMKARLYKCAKPEVVHKRIKISVVVEQNVPVCNAFCRYKRVDRASNSDTEAAQRSKILRCSYGDFLSA